MHTECINQIISWGEGILPSKIESTLQHPLIHTDIHSTDKIRVSFAKFSWFPLQSESFPKFSSLVVTDPNPGKSFANHLQGIQVVTQHCIHKILHLLQGLNFTLQLICIVLSNVLTVSNRGETNRQGWQSDVQGKMLVLSEGDVSMGINNISSPQVNGLTLITIW